MATPDLQTRVETTLEELRPYLKADGGDIRLVEITEELVVRIELLGACADCSMINMTLKGGVESALKKAAPELKAIEAINLV
ncbi:NifU family protein [Flavobacteriales bacterium]|nr:NifU family protein [Flavobacteriales bacterium]